MLLSVITACLPGRDSYLWEAAASIPAGLGEDWEVEWVLVYDGPGGEPVTAECLRREIVLLHHEGVSAARNRALFECRGEWVVNLDADDRLVTAGMNVVARTISERNRMGEGVGWAAGALAAMGESGCYPPLTAASHRLFTPGELVSEWTVPMAFHPGVTWMRRDLLLAMGGWPALTAVEDKLPVLGVSELAGGFTLPVITHEYRRHEGQLTRSEAHAKSRKYALDYTCEVLTARRRIVDPAVAAVAPKPLSEGTR